MDQKYTQDGFNKSKPKVDYSDEKFELKFNKSKSNDISSFSNATSKPDAFSETNSAFDQKNVFSSVDEVFSPNDISSNNLSSNSIDKPKDVFNSEFFDPINSVKVNEEFQMIDSNAFSEIKSQPQTSQRVYEDFASSQDKKPLFEDVESETQMKKQTPPPTGNSRIPAELRKTNAAQVNRTPQASAISKAATQNFAKSNADEDKKTKRKKKKGGKGKKIAAVILSLFAIFLISTFAFAYSLLGNLTYDSDYIDENQYIDSSLLFSDDSLINILFLGSDAREDLGSSRSDTMMLCTIDTSNKEIKLTSFLRDSYVYIPSVGYSTKLNAAFSYGGAQLAIDTIEYNFKIDIDNYVMVDFETFELLVDLLGGITVDDVTTAEANYMNDVVKISGTPLVEGTNEMDGNTALWYCRIRYLDSDFYRTERQRKVIESIIDKISETDWFTLIDIMEEVLPNVSTNISQNEIVSLAFKAISCLSYDITQMQIPVDGTWYNDTINSQAVLVMDIDENAQLLEEYLSNPSADEDEE